MIMKYKDKSPKIGEGTYVIPSADIIGDVTIGERCTIWSNASIRGDMDAITIGDETSIQENAALHISENAPLTVGNRVTVAHGVILHSCTIEDNCCIGMGCIILDGAVIGKNSMVAAGALVTPGKVYPPNSVIMGSPAKVVRKFEGDALQASQDLCQHYVKLAEEYLAQEEA